jgi:hypothetical protein
MYLTCYFKLKFHDIYSYYAISKFLYHLYQCFVVVVTVCMQINCHTLQNCANFLDGNVFYQDAVEILNQGCAARVVCLQSGADSQKICLFKTFRLANTGYI